MENDFIKWTNALVEWFFGEQSDEEVFLYVNKEILDQIGDKYKLGDHNSFLETTMLSPANRINLYDDLSYASYGHKGRRTPQDNRRIKANSILNFAYLLGNKYDKDLYYFPYIILAIYIASLTDANSDNAVGRHLRDYLKEKIREGENGNYEALKDLFQMLHDDFPMFNNRIRGQHKYVGLLKYQLLLNKKQIREIRDALYSISYEDDAQLPYTEKVRKIIDYVHDPIKNLLRLSLNNADYQIRINSIFENFDLGEYTINRESVRDIKKHADFALLLFFSDSTEDRGFRLLTNYNSSSIHNDQYDFNPSIDTINGYNANYVKYNNSDIVSLEVYRYNTRSVDIKSMPLDEVAFFYKYDENNYLQSRDAQNREVYIFVKRKNEIIIEWENWAKINVRDICRIDETENVTDLTGENWTLYYGSGVLTSYYNDIRNAGSTYRNNVQEIKLKGGIIPPGKINTYLINALPYFEFPEEINKGVLTLDIKVDDKPLNKDHDFLWYVQGNKLIIDIINDIDLGDSHGIVIEIKYDRDKSINSFYVCAQNIRYNIDNLYCYDKWGDIKRENIPERYIRGNNINGICCNDLGNDCVNFTSEEITDFDFERDIKNFYFINLLSSCIYMEPNSMIIRKKLEKCIRYAATRLKIDTNETAFTTKVINLLVNAGYIAADYQSLHYQMIPTSIVRVPLHVGMTGQLSGQIDFSGKVYMLIGAYTKKFVKDLCDFCRSKNYLVKQHYSVKLSESHGRLRLLPPILLLDKRFNYSCFISEYPEHKVNYIQTDYALDLLSLTPTISEYESTLTKIDAENFNVELTPAQRPDFPRIREDSPYAYYNHVYIEKCEREFYKPSVSDHAWDNIYCYFKRGYPYIIRKSDQIFIPTDLHLPSLIQRSLFISNIGVASYKKVFMCNNPINDGKFYMLTKSYKVSRDKQAKLFSILTGADASDTNALVRNAVSSKSRDNRNPWTYEMKLWTRKNPMDRTVPKCLLVLEESTHFIHMTTRREQLAVADNRNVYVKNNGRMLSVNGSLNAIMTTIIMNHNRYYGEITFENDPLEFSFPDKCKYNIESITIL